MGSVDAQKINLTVSFMDLVKFSESLIAETKRQLKTTVEEENQDRLITRNETAEMLKVSFPTLWRWEQRGTLVPVRIGKRNLYSLNDVKKIMYEGTEDE